VRRGQSKQDYATPPEFMAAVSQRFGPINFDLAASEHNAKHANYFSAQDDSLRQEWHKVSGVLWLNPPFDNIAPWAAKCKAESRGRRARILFLTPASIGANWFAEHVHGHAQVLALNGRISFDGVAPYPKDCMLSCFGFGYTGFDVWAWRANQ
jgi:phage N-6-adenine-methyltransferase